MRMAIVGNGPSAVKFGKEIDAHDVVVRINAFPFGEAGCKWDVWSTDLFCSVKRGVKRMKLNEHTHLPSEIWKLGRLHDVQSLYNVRPDIKIVTTNGNDRQELKKYLGTRPTSGMVTLREALNRKPSELGLFGFDATTPTADGWGHWWGNEWNDDRTLEVHNMSKEKEAIAEWCESRTFCGIEFPDTQPAWWR